MIFIPVNIFCKVYLQPFTHWLSIIYSLKGRPRANAALAISYGIKWFVVGEGLVHSKACGFPLHHPEAWALACLEAFKYLNINYLFYSSKSPHSFDDLTESNRKQKTGHPRRPDPVMKLDKNNRSASVLRWFLFLFPTKPTNKKSTNKTDTSIRADWVPSVKISGPADIRTL